MDDCHRYRVEPGSRPRLADLDPAEHEGATGKREAKARIEATGRRLRELQYLLYAENRRSLLVCLQALDAGGKDGTIRHVLGYMNPQGCRVHAFRVPNEEEAARDFLWRVHRRTPRRGEVAIFNRSHYEDVLVARVHGLVPKAVWSRRYAAINEFERLLHENGTHILKFFLHISKEEQLRRFRKRLEDPGRQWKISEADYEERRYWDDYQLAYEDALHHCSTAHAPWYVIPADHKWYRNLAVSQILLQTLEGLQLQLPPPRVDLEAIRRRYHRELADKDGRED
ncbi:polyphosphate kinase 2 family protein [Thiohalobacter sp. IOR34]|uniref:polyphosphate kinase 2 family protein n=1 Tax=Thiohalobacter sp. IOR34 TaxID=3057176 RepID=UPI0025AF1553|nr:polyphosphate kinase 2 family protein [Thiohalobacter sp. IOR34]WJW76350.1 polyphosphate kinase 2 family protein [Thiohalobacter sp. IOR34]